MITKIEFSNLKGSTGSLETAPLTVITGGNFRGKTTILQAIILACNGFIPGLGKTNASTFQLSSGPVMTAGVSGPAGFINRKWKQSGKAIKLTTEEDCQWPQIGGMIAADSFTQAKPADRLAMLAAAAGGAAALPELELAIQDACRLASAPMPSGETPLDRAAAALDELKAMIADSKARKVQFEKTLAGLAQINAEGSPTGPPPDTAKALAEAQRTHDAAVAAERNVEAAAEDHSDALDVLESFLSANPHADIEPSAPEYSGTASRHLGEAVAELKNLESRLAAARAALAPVQEYDADRLAKLEAQDLQEWNEKLKAAEKSLSDDRFDKNRIQNRRKELEDRAKKMQSLTCCPTCHASGTGWLDSVLGEMEAEDIILHGEVVKLLESITKAEASLEVIQTNLGTLNKELPVLRRYKESNERSAAAAGEVETLQEQITQVEARRQELQKHADEERKSGEIYNGKLRLHSEWKRLAGKVDQYAAAPEKLAAAREAAAAAYNAMAAASRADEAAEPARQAWADHQGRTDALGKARAEAEKEEATLKKLEGAANALKGVRDTEMRKMFTPVIEAAERMSGDILPTPLTLHPTNGQIGRFNGTTFIPFEAMSGTEQLVAVASLQVALAAGGTVLLDEVARMDETTKAKFLTRLEQMHAAGQLEQAILIDHSAGNYPDSWKRIAV